MTRWAARLALALVAALALAYAGAERGLMRLDDEERRAMVARGEAERFAVLTDGVAHYRVGGPEADAPVLLVHGFSSPGFVWLPYMEALAAAGFRVLVPDLYGRGFSDRPPGPYDADLFDRQLVGLLDALGAGEPIHLVGKSMGGAVATLFAARHPERVRSLTLIAPAVFGASDSSAVITLPILGDWFFKVAGGRFLAKRAEAWAANHPDPAAFRAGFQRQFAYPGYPQAMLSTLRHFMRTDFEPFRAQVGSARYPVLLIWGSADREVPASRAAELVGDVPRAQLEILEGATHAVERQRFERVRALLEAHLRRAASAPQPTS